MSGEIRAAASVIAAREGARGPEVLVIERSLKSRFLPGYVAFPGGATDDADTKAAELWFGSTGEAPRACAVRELFEEVGLLLTAEGLGAGAARSLDLVAADPPSADQLPEIARWIAPEDVPVRFDARYYAVASSADVEPTPDGHEASLAWWVSPASLLEEWEGERRKLFWPTYLTLRALAACGSVDELVRLRIETREPDDDELEWLHRSTFYQD